MTLSSEGIDALKADGLVHVKFIATILAEYVWIFANVVNFR
jgi:hypothetical protein